MWVSMIIVKLIFLGLWAIKAVAYSAIIDNRTLNNEVLITSYRLRR